MTARKPRTITETGEAEARRFCSKPELMFTWDIWAELDAEREVSRKLAAAVRPFAESKDMDEIPWKFILQARAALGQYATQGEDCGRERG